MKTPLESFFDAYHKWVASLPPPSPDAGKCLDCGYSIFGPDGTQHDLLCFGRCLKCSMRAQRRGGEHG